MGAVKKLTIISIIGASVLGTFKRLSTGKKCYGIKVRRKHFWKLKKRSLGMLFKSIMKLLKVKRERKSIWKRMVGSAW
ncbi:MAG TPA: hypothetical protein VHP36_04255 [Chitinispirillaceae bacterium]|nr:hypothetical protein [Chitinispirillaceae bacterium]